ncbi:MAG TPA: glycosyltransferase family 4 protein [Solirubrobacteraceae bacterium]|nr:glycosyltransferase family 4 protein [Solirubrobacteraceae bacterium]
MSDTGEPNGGAPSSSPGGAPGDAAARRAQRAGERPRLLLLTPDYPPSHGGIQLMAHRLACDIGGFQTRVLALDCPGAREFDAGESVDVRRVRSRGGSPPARGAQLNLAGVLAALRFRPHVTLNLHLIASPAAVLIRSLLGAPTVQVFHAQEIGGKPRLAAFAAARADVVIAVSRYTAGLVAATGASPARLRLISPGVDLPPERSGRTADGPERTADGPAPAAQGDGRPTFVTVARLRDSYKGHDVLVRALPAVRARVPDVQWAVIGEGPLRPELERMAREQGVADCVRFLGALEDEQRDGWLARADLLAMPSRLPGGKLAGEGFGIAFLEAGAHGKPVVAGAVGGALDAVLDGQTGLLVDPTNPQAVADAIVRLLLDRELAQRLGRAGAEHARSLAWPLVAERVEGALFEALERRGAERVATRPST